MKKISLIALIPALLCSQAVLAKSQTVALNVPTMDCATCPITIKAALVKVPGVSQARVSYQKREAVVVYDDSKTNVDELKKATSDAGYPSLLKSPAPASK
jgi:mercuric ion binding protein